MDTLQPGDRVRCFRGNSAPVAGLCEIVTEHTVLVLLDNGQRETFFVDELDRIRPLTEKDWLG